MAQPGSKISQGLSYRELPNKAYQATRGFFSGANTGTGLTNTTGALFTYSTSLNSQFQTVGSLVFNAGSTAGNSQTGRVLHANGKVLIPNVHPGGGAGVNPSTGATGTTPNPLPFPMIGVYDPVSGLNGYINPQDPTWATYDASLSAFYDNAATPATTLGGQGAEPRYGAAAAATASAALSATVSIGAARTGTITTQFASNEITVTSSEVNANSIILLTLQNSTVAAGTGAPSLRVASISAGTSFVIRSAALAVGDVIHFLIIN
jgi:hypothetical protein